jgi:hypothetical protein
MSELGSALRSELGSPESQVRSELASEAATRSELGSPESHVRSELATEGTARSELASPIQLSELLSNEVYEMPGSDVPELDGGKTA